MKYILTILLVAFLSGCNLSTGETGKKIGAGVAKCCRSLGLAKSSKANSSLETEGSSPILEASFTERSGEILTW